MTAGVTYCDVVSSETQPSREARKGEAYIAAIGIDRYRAWKRLYNAVSDAQGALRLFAGLGFKLVAPRYSARAPPATLAVGVSSTICPGWRG